MKALLTGASGFIAAPLARKLKSAGVRTVGCDVRPAARAVCDQFVELDIRKPVHPQPFDGVDTVFHLAGRAHALSETAREDREYFRVNTEGTRRVLEAAGKANVRRFVFFSSIKAMSRDEHWEATRPRAEQNATEPDTPYGWSKLEAERLVLQGGYVPEPVVLRLCLVYGPGVKGNLDRMLRAIKAHRFPPLPETHNRRSMVHVEDVAQAAWLCATEPAAIGEVFIVSDAEAYSTRQIYEMAARALGVPVSRFSVPLWGLQAMGLAGDALGRVRGRRCAFDTCALYKLLGSAWFSCERIQARLGYHPAWNWERALPQMVQSF